MDSSTSNNGLKKEGLQRPDISRHSGHGRRHCCASGSVYMGCCLAVGYQQNYNYYLHLLRELLQRSYLAPEDVHHELLPVLAVL